VIVMQSFMSASVMLKRIGRVLSDLNVVLICVNSSQANAWLPDFIADFNRRFAKLAHYPKDMHRPVRESVDELDDIFARQELRKLSKSLTLQYDKFGI